MASYFFDSYAIIELIKGNEKYEKYKDATIITNTLHLAEVLYSLLLRIDHNSAMEIIANFDFEFIDITPEISLESALFKFKHKDKKLSYADCIGYISAIKSNMLFLTGDKEFEKLPNVEFVKK